MNVIDHYNRAVWHLQRQGHPNTRKAVRHMAAAAWHLAQVGQHARQAAASSAGHMGHHIGQGQVVAPAGG